jgi:hypothetical protein
VDYNSIVEVLDRAQVAGAMVDTLFFSVVLCIVLSLLSYSVVPIPYSLESVINFSCSKIVYVSCAQ